VALAISSTRTGFSNREAGPTVTPGFARFKPLVAVRRSCLHGAKRARREGRRPDPTRAAIAPCLAVPAAATYKSGAHQRRAAPRSNSPLMTHSSRAPRRRPCATRAHRCAAISVISLLVFSVVPATAREISQQRMTPVVAAVKLARPAVVSIRGEKTEVEGTAKRTDVDEPRHVNGMGTGTIVDERGYILTNYHVVSDVRRIEVTLDDGRQYTAEVISHDAAADLAVIKIPSSKPLPIIRLGTSSDLMDGESVIALGNAFGYEQTVTRGIVSALGRDVQVSDTQSYDDLIQTDASINPGNSGGPLLNIDGEMIGVNVAVRAGAQGIGFAIPIDSALAVTARLMSVERLRNTSHGLSTQVGGDFDAPVRVTKVTPASPAEALGIQPGDEIVSVGTLRITRPLDLERAFLDRAAGQPVSIELRRNGQTMMMDLALAESQSTAIAARTTFSDNDAKVWDVLGLRLSEEPKTTFQRRNSRYRGGMHVEEVRPGSPAAEEGIQPGDILVGMHKWETASQQDVQYIVSRPSLAQMGKLKFYVLRGQSTLFGHINVATKGDGATSR
jgi:serine protease Do